MLIFCVNVSLKYYSIITTTTINTEVGSSVTEVFYNVF